MNFTEMSSGERIKKLRIYLGLTLEAFGNKLGVTKTAISNIEKGYRNLTNQMIKSICREFDVNYEWLVHGTGEIFISNHKTFSTGERVRLIRNKLNLTLENFGNRIGLKRSALSHIENNVNSLTDSNIRSICREFNVNYEWLVHGNGEMFNCDIDELASITNQVQRIMNGDNEYHKTLLKLVLSLNEDQLELFLKLRNFAK